VPTGPPPGSNTGPVLPSVGPVDKDGKFYTGSWLIAIDPATQKEKWRVQGGGGIGGGTLTTAGNLVLQTTNQGRLLAYRADTGEKLHEINTNQTGGIGRRSRSWWINKQYVAVAGGMGARGGFGWSRRSRWSRRRCSWPRRSRRSTSSGWRSSSSSGAPAGAQRGNAPATPPPPATPPRLYGVCPDGKAVNPTPEPPPAPAGGAGLFGPPPSGSAGTWRARPVENW
jgi:hypothetical protein